MIAGQGAGKIRGLYIMGENPAMTDPDIGHAQKCMAACEFVVLQEIFPTETAALADVLLPGLMLGGKEGTFTNTDRRIQLVRQAIDPLGKPAQTGGSSRILLTESWNRKSVCRLGVRLPGNMRPARNHG